MTLLYVIGEGGRPAYAIHSSDVQASDLPQEPEASAEILRGDGSLDAIHRLEQAAQAVADACEHILERVRDGLSEAAPTELELTFNVSFAGEGGIPVIGKASAEAGIQVRAMWSKGSAD